MVLDIKNLKKVYEKGTMSECCALRDISFSVDEGESIAIVGKSGSGKSTLLHILGLLDSYDEGSLLLFGKDVNKLSEKQRAEYRNKYIGFVMQDFALVTDLSVFDNVAVPLYIAGEKGSVIQKSVYTLLNNVGLNEKARIRAGSLSGGQKQRVALARALVNSPKLILADEPTGALDQKTGKEMMNLLLFSRAKDSVLIIVTHDIEIANMCNRVIKIQDGMLSDDAK